MALFEEIGSGLIAELERKNAAREKALTASRELTRSCALSIRAIHRGETDRALELRTKAKAISDQMVEAVKDYPDLRFAGYVQDSQKELVEASVTYAIINREALPTPDEMGIEPAAYLNGTAEAVGELRRYILDKLRHGDTSRCEEILQVMDDIYSVLVTVDFPDALTGGLRRTTDSVRGIMEKTRGDLTTALRQRDLEAALRQVPGFGQRPVGSPDTLAVDADSEEVPSL
ncbi:MAG TPA: haloacid dehalogenase [Chloroflexota bacterium]